MNTNTEAVIRQVGTYAGGTPSLEIHVSMDAAASLPFQLDTRVPIELRLGRSIYRAGLRATARSRLVWVCPDMTDHRGTRTTLGKELTVAGYRPNDHVALQVEQNTITLIRSSALHRTRAAVAAKRTSHASTPRSRETDPLAGFDWSELYTRYDRKCIRFDATSEHLSELEPPPMSDRELYYWLAKRLSSASERGPVLDVAAYQALLYWKLYSQPAALHNLGTWFSGDRPADITPRLEALPVGLRKSLSHDWSDIRSALRMIGEAALPGMRSSTALPVRTTLLHFLYPTVVPIFDKMVLQAVGMWSKDANTRLDVLERYLPLAWTLADRYAPLLAGFSETPVRLVDMALWVTRGAR